MKLISFLIFCLSVNSHLFAQVEVFRKTEDTSTYIAPEDTVTKAPVFENGDQDFLRYLETHFNLRTNSNLDYAGESIRFSFYVEKDGDIEGYEQLYGSNAIVASEIERIITTMPKWNPGYLDGRKKKTLMVYNILIKKVDDFPPVQITLNNSTLEYTDQTRQIKWFIIGGSLLILITLQITSILR